MKSKWPVPSKETTIARYADVYKVYEQVLSEMNSSSARIFGKAPSSIAGVKVILGEVEQRLSCMYDMRHIYRIVRTVQQHYGEFFRQGRK
jgi:hypothetical protein